MHCMNFHIIMAFCAIMELATTSLDQNVRSLNGYDHCKILKACISECSLKKLHVYMLYLCFILINSISELMLYTT